MAFNLFRDLHRCSGAWYVPLFYGKEDRRRAIALSLFHFPGIGLIYDRVSVTQVDHIKRSSEYKFLSHSIHLCCISHIEKMGRLIHPVFKDPIQHETNHIVSDNRGLAGLGKEPEHIVNGLLTCPFPVNDLHGQAAPGRRKKMGDRRPFRMLHVCENPVRRDGTGVGCNDGILPYNPFHHLKYLFFQIEVFGCRLNHQIAISDLFVMGRIGDIFQNGLGLLLSHLFSGYRLLGVSMKAFLSILEGFLGHIHQKKFFVREPASQIVGDIRTDSAGADHGHLLRQGSTRFYEKRIEKCWIYLFSLFHMPCPPIL